MTDYAPLQGFVGFLGKDPESKQTSKGRVVKTSLGVSDGFGDNANISWFNLDLWAEGHQQAALEGQLYKGAQVAVLGNVKQREGYQPDVSAVRLGIVNWIPRNSQVQQPQPTPDEEDVDF